MKFKDLHEGALFAYPGLQRLFVKLPQKLCLAEAEARNGIRSIMVVVHESLRPGSMCSAADYDEVELVKDISVTTIVSNPTRSFTVVVVSRD